MACVSNEARTAAGCAARVLGFLRSPVFLLAVVGWMAVLLVWGTLRQSAPGGLDAARALIFDAWVVRIGRLPAPAMMTTLGMLCLGLVARLVPGPPGRRGDPGARCVEAGILILLLGRGLTGPVIDGARLTLMEGESSSQIALADGGLLDLPFSVRLLSFERALHAGSSVPRHFGSHLEIRDGATTREAHIAMNRPFHHRGYGFYQLSFAQTALGTFSTLGVARRPLRQLPILSTTLIALGLFRRAARPRRRRPSAATTACRVLLCGAWPAATGADAIPAGALAPLPIQSEGRIMPLDTFARLQWLRLSGRAAPAGGAAIDWLASAWFDPATAVSNRFFLVQTPELAALTGLDWRGRRVKASYAELAPQRPAIAAAAGAVRARPREGHSSADRDALRLDSALTGFERLPLVYCRGLVPVSHADVTAWKPIPEALAPPWNAPPDDPGVGTWQALAAAHRANDDAAFASAAGRWMRYAHAVAPEAVHRRRLRWEVRLNRLDPLRRSAALCALAFLVALAAGVAPAAERHLRRGAMALSMLAAAILTAGLALRTVLLGRPPVTNLHAAFLFAAWAALIFGIAAARRPRGAAALLAATPLTFLLLRAAVLIAAEKDTLGRVVAILDTSFWLGLHVITIIVGFSACLLAAALAHVALPAAARGVRAPAEDSPTDALLRNFLGIGLGFTLLGTLLGGLWADVAWGRFWGWDPKENGALLVILWMGVAWELRACGRIGPRGMAVAAWVGGWVVMATWQGVNALGMGRHSYGFSEGQRALLVAFVLDAAWLAAVPAFARLRSPTR